MGPARSSTVFFSAPAPRVSVTVWLAAIALALSACHGGGSHQTSNNKAAFQLRSGHADVCLGCMGDDRVGAAACKNDDAGQSWLLVGTCGNNGHAHICKGKLMSERSERCLSRTAESGLTIAACHDAPKWVFVEDRNGFGTVRQHATKQGYIRLPCSTAQTTSCRPEELVFPFPDDWFPADTYF